MKFGMNIGRTGRLLRFLAGLLLGASGVLGLIVGVPGEGWVARTFLFVLIAAGGFAMLEGAVGWCALRGMGFKTRI